MGPTVRRGRLARRTQFAFEDLQPDQGGSAVDRGRRGLGSVLDQHTIFREEGDVTVNQGMDELMDRIGKESQLRADTLERLLSAADSAKVFGPAVVSGDSTVITAAEVAAGGGFGSGMGFGLPAGRKGMPEMVKTDNPEGVPPGAGGGGGGGGGSMGRPVAVITVRPDGIKVKPVLDLTKISLTAMAAVVSLTVLCIKLRWKR
jgi:uncharacterized spore protein YtfJ